MTGITVVQLVHNIEKIKYPWPMSLESALPIADKIIVVCAGPHEDKTERWVNAFAKANGEKVSVIAENPRFFGTCPADYEFAYYTKLAWPKTKDGLARLVQLGFDLSNTDIVMQLQADEILDEEDYPKYLSMKDSSAAAWRFGFRHFCHDFGHIQRFMYGAVDWGDAGVVRACRFDSDYVNTDDAVQMVGNGPVEDLGNVIWHCGKIDVGREEAASFKEMDFQALYPPPFPDPKMVAAFGARWLSYEDIFADAYKHGNVKYYDGRLPRYVQAYKTWLNTPT